MAMFYDSMVVHLFDAGQLLMAERKESMILFRKHYSDLCEVIHNADWIAIQLYSEGLLAMSTRRDIEETPKQTEKNIKLLSSIERVLLINPEKFEEFLHVLGREQYLRSLVDRIRCSLCKFQLLSAMFKFLSPCTI